MASVVPIRKYSTPDLDILRTFLPHDMQSASPTMNTTLAIRLAAITGFLAVALGAFGAHSLKAALLQNDTLAVWQTGALYHLVHAVVLLLLAQRSSVPRWPFTLFGVGILIFSGSLYVLAVTNIKILGAITPFGGLCLLAGWLTLAIRPPQTSE